MPLIKSLKQKFQYHPNAVDYQYRLCRFRVSKQLARKTVIVISYPDYIMFRRHPVTRIREPFTKDKTST